MKPKRTLILTLISSILSLAAASEARDQLPLGHPDFYPSPERPIGWRGDGTCQGSYPGASLVDRFAEGPAVMADVKKGRRTLKMPYAGSGDSVNIAWKFPLPGFTMSQPVVVGDRVIQTCEPRSVLCIEVATGKELWRQELCPFTMIGLEGKAREKSLLLESTSWILHALSKNLQGNYTRLNGEDNEKSRAKWLAQAKRMRTAIEMASEAWPELSAKAMQDVEQIESSIRDSASNFGASGTKPGPARKKCSELFADMHNIFSSHFHHLHKFHSTMHWYSYIGWTWPCPVSDGTWVYVYMNQGQIARLSLADGSINWMRQLHKFNKGGQANGNKQPVPRSPLLHKGVLIVPVAGCLFGVEAETGKELWKTEITGMDDISAVNPCLVHLADRTIIAANGNTKAVGDRDIRFVDPANGNIVGTFVTKNGAHDPGPSLMSKGDILASSYAGQILRVTADGDRVTATELWTHKTNGNNAVCISGDQYFNLNAIYNLEDGKVLGGSERLRKGGISLNDWKPGIIVGDRILGSYDSGGGGSAALFEAEGLHHKPHFFPIHSLDAKPISTDNFLEWTSETRAPHVVPQAERYFSDDFNGNHLGNLCAGLPAVFSYAGSTAHGNRVLIPSLTHLYCIGDPSQPYTGRAGP